MLTIGEPQAKPPTGRGLLPESAGAESASRLSRAKPRGSGAQRGIRFLRFPTQRKRWPADVNESLVWSEWNESRGL
jgi:hypothetical protein